MFTRAKVSPNGPDHDRRVKLDALGEIADDPVRCHEYLMKSSLLAMVREANATA